MIVPDGVPPLAASECQVWWASPSLAHPGHLELLDDVERGRRQGFRRPEDRDRYTAAVALTRVVLGALLDTAPASVGIDRSCPDCGKGHGKPRLIGRSGDLHVSISHSGDRIAVAVTLGVEVGVDVEEVVDLHKLEGLDRHVLAKGEKAELLRLPAELRASAFLRYWTLKEAILKATGDGLRESPAALTLTAPAERPRLVAWPSRPDVGANLTLQHLHAGHGYVASLALLTAAPRTVIELDARPLLTGRLSAAAPGGR